jgi:hypothetical protein
MLNFAGCLLVCSSAVYLANYLEGMFLNPFCASQRNIYGVNRIPNHRFLQPIVVEGRTLQTFFIIE